MTRREASKLIGYALGAPIAVPAISQTLGAHIVAKKPILLQKSTWTNKENQLALNAILDANLFNAGFPQENINIRFFPGSMPDPAAMLKFNVHEIGIGSDYANELFGDFDMGGMMDEMMGQGLEDLLSDPRAVDQMLAEASAFADGLEAMTRTGIAPAVAVAAAAVAVSYGGLLLTAFKTGYEIGKDYRAHSDDDGDGVLNKDDRFPNDPNQNFKAADVNGNGIPDDIEGDLIPSYYRSSMVAAGFNPNDFAKSGVTASIMADGESFIVNFEIENEGRSMSTQVALTA